MQFETCALEESRRCIVSVISSIDVNVAMRPWTDPRHVIGRCVDVPEI